jgi:adenylate cyclase
MRRVSAPTITIALIGFTFDRYLADDPNQSDTANYLRSGLHGIGVAAVGWGAHLFFNSRGSGWLRKWPLAAEMIVRAIAMTLAVSAATTLLQMVLYGQRLHWHWFTAELPRIVALALAMSVLFGAVFELVRLVGGRVLLNVCLGRYRHPTREERVLTRRQDRAGSTLN